MHPWSAALTCVDVSQAWLRAARRTTARYANVAFEWGEIAALDLAEGAYEMVFIHFVLHDISAERRPDTVRHLAAKLSAGGRLCLREPTGKGHGMPPREIHRLMIDAGLSEVSLETRKLLWIQPVCDGLYVKPG